VIGSGLAILLGTAALLTPDSRGHGTHEQLGLSPCTFATLAGRRCPACGMTTAWSHLMRGNVFVAARTHASGTMLGILAVVLSACCLGYAVVGNLRVRLPSERVLLLFGIAMLMFVLVEWLMRLSEQGFRFGA
jgi:hypothetical protein